VSNGNNDNITVIDLAKDTILTGIYLKPHEIVRNFRGVIPFGLAISPDQKRLYVAESGINAIGVIDIPTFKVIGHIPTGWFPSKLKVTPGGRKLVVANAKGFGSGPNGGKDFKRGAEGTYIGSLMKGTVQILDIPDDAELQGLTEKVIANNFKISLSDDHEFDWRKNNPVPLFGGQKGSPVKHIVFISKENRTYDEVFGQIEKGNGDATIARYGSGVTFTNRSGSDTVINATIMPNHLKLAKEFSIADNFYVDSDVSADGHRWLANTYPNEWVEATTPASYGGNRDFKPGSKAPGIYAMNSSAGAVYPEDYNEAGSIWDHLARNEINFFNFGFGIMFEPAIYHEAFKYTGVRHFVNFPVPQPMFSRTSKMYPTYNTAIPDQFRIDQFIKEFNEKWMDGRNKMPQIITVIIPNDHGAGERPEAGYPFRESYMADNDLAVGRIVEFLSHTSYWKNMAIIITEDDAQNGVDHVDAHRSILMVISPWAKKDYVGHAHYSFGSIFKTFWNILGLPYLNQYDAAATDLADMFTDKPDFKPFTALPSDQRFFDPQKALNPFDEQFNWKAIEESPVIDKTEDMLKESKETPAYRLEDQERKK
jgi:YVTN family beta-propeller protein